MHQPLTLSNCGAESRGKTDSTQGATEASTLQYDLKLCNIVIGERLLKLSKCEDPSDPVAGDLCGIVGSPADTPSLV